MEWTGMANYSSGQWSKSHTTFGTVRQPEKRNSRGFVKFVFGRWGVIEVNLFRRPRIWFFLCKIHELKKSHVFFFILYNFLRKILYRRRKYITDWKLPNPTQMLTSIRIFREPFRIIHFSRMYDIFQLCFLNVLGFGRTKWINKNYSTF